MGLEGIDLSAPLRPDETYAVHRHREVAPTHTFSAKNDAWNSSGRHTPTEANDDHDADRQKKKKEKKKVVSCGIAYSNVNFC